MERERKLRALAVVGDAAEGSSGFLTPNDSLVSSSAGSTGTNYSNGSSQHSAGSGLSGGSRSYLPDRLQIVKPLEGEPGESPRDVRVPYVRLRACGRDGFGNGEQP